MPKNLFIKDCSLWKIQKKYVPCKVPIQVKKTLTERPRVRNNCTCRQVMNSGSILLTDIIKYIKNKVNQQFPYSFQVQDKILLIIEYLRQPVSEL